MMDPVLPRSAPDAAPPLRVAIVAPSMRILGGQAVQAERLLRAWQGDDQVSAWLVPINPLPPRWLRWALGITYARTLATQIAYWPLLVRELRRADIAHVFSASYFSFLLAPLPAFLVARLLQRPVILNYRSGEAPDHLQRSAIARTTIARVDRNVVPSRFLQEVFASFGVPAHVVPNIVDMERFPFRLRDPIAPKLVSTRNFEPLYNVACTLRAFRLVQDECPDASLTLVGAGSGERSLRELAGRLALRHVTFAGRVAPVEVWRYYDDADIYVQTPDIDNMPSSVLEAFSSGTPVVSTNVGGVPALLTDEVDGLLAPPDDHAAIARQILRLLRQPGLAARLATSARAECERYTWPRVRGQWLSVYRAAASRRPPLALAAPSVDAAPAAAPSRAARDPRLARLGSMDSAEIRFRARTLLTRGARRLRAIARPAKWRRTDLASRLVAGAALQPALARLEARDWAGAHDELSRYLRDRPSRFVIDLRSRQPLAAAITARFPRATDDARRRADQILAGRYDLLGYTNLEFTRREQAPRPAKSGREWPDPDWAYDPVHDKRAPEAWWSDVRYLDPRFGDHKIIWELNRHQHWLALGRAYWLTGCAAYRARFVAELESWLAQNPPLVGINWASMLELGFRSVSWLWALHFFLDAPEDANETPTQAPWLVDLLLGLDRQMRHVEENLSQYFSPNTHLTGEALGLYVVGRTLPELRAASRWEALGRRVLIEQAAKQVAPDGGHLERSTHYHRYTLDFYLLALAVARRTGDEVAERAFEPLVTRLARFAWAMADATGSLPRIGDDDAGALLPICGNDASDVRPSLSMAAALLPGRVPADEPTEESFWISGAGGLDGTRTDVPDATSADWDQSVVFPTTGYYVSRSRSGDHLVFDAGPHGFLNGGHAHADALSLTLSLRWHRLFIDTGTGTYTMDPALRDRFRSTALHNTLVLDDRSQSQPDGPFHWTTAADGRVVRSAFNPRFDFFEAQHDGYLPAIHRRAVFSAAGDLWLVTDHVLGRGRHTAAVQWHLDPEWNVRNDATAIEAAHADGLCAAIATTAKRLEMFRGDRTSGLGWCSPAYGRIVPCPALRFSRTGEAPLSVATVIVPLHRASDVSVEPVTVSGGPGNDAYAHAIRIVLCDEVALALFAVPRDESRPGAPATALKWQFADWETDARFAFVRLSTQGAVRAVSIVGGSFLQRISNDPFRLQLDHVVGDLAVDLEPGGLLDLFSSAPLPAVGLDAPASVINRVRLNDSPMSFGRAAAAVLVPSAQAGRWRRQPIAEAAVGQR